MQADGSRSHCLGDQLSIQSCSGPFCAHYSPGRLHMTIDVGTVPQRPRALEGPGWLLGAAASWGQSQSLNKTCRALLGVGFHYFSSPFPCYPSSPSFPPVSRTSWIGSCCRAFAQAVSCLNTPRDKLLALSLASFRHLLKCPNLRGLLIYLALISI